jgi:hypothetical protein
MLPQHKCVFLADDNEQTAKYTPIEVMTINRCHQHFYEMDQTDGHILVTMQTKQLALQIGTYD